MRVIPQNTVQTNSPFSEEDVSLLRWKKAKQCSEIVQQRSFDGHSDSVRILRASMRSNNCNCNKTWTLIVNYSIQLIIIIVIIIITYRKWFCEIQISRRWPVVVPRVQHTAGEHCLPTSPAPDQARRRTRCLLPYSWQSHRRKYCTTDSLHTSTVRSICCGKSVYLSVTPVYQNSWSYINKLFTTWCHSSLLDKDRKKFRQTFDRYMAISRKCYGRKEWMIGWLENARLEINDGLVRQPDVSRTP